MNLSSIIGLVNNATLLLALSLIYDMLGDRPQVKKNSVQQILTGIALGAIGIAIMLNPWEFMPGVVFDTRSVLLSISGLFLGTIPTLLAVLITGSYRLYLSGTVAWTGVAVIATSGGIGLLWRHLRCHKEVGITTRELYFFGITVHIAMLLWMFSLPWPVAKGVLSKISLPVLLIFPVTTALLGWLMTNRGSRKRAEEDLRQSEERFRYLSDGSMEAIFFTKNGFCLEANQVAVEIFGYDDRAQFIGLFGTEIIAPESHDIVKSHMLTNTFESYEAIGIRKNGTRFPIAIRSKAMPYKDEGIVRVTSIADISETKKIEKALRESENRFKALHNASFGGIAIHDKGIILECNHGLTVISGYSEVELKSMDGLMLIAEKSRDLVSNNISTGYEKPYEAMGLRKNGEEYPMRLEARNVPYKGKNVRTVEFRDITERKRDEEALRKSEAQMRAITDSAQDAILMMDQNGRISYWNPAAESIFGYTCDEAIGKNLHQLIAPQRYHEAHHAAFARFQQTGQGNVVDSTLELKACHKNGHEISVELSLSSLHLQDCWHSVGIIRDITERKQAEEEKAKLEGQIQRAQKMESIGSLAGGIAHDLNNILFPISGLSEMLLDDIPPDTPEHKSIEQIYKSAKRGSDLVKQILSFSRQSNPKKLPIRIQPILKEALKLAQATIPRNIEIKSHINTDCGMISADPTQIHQIAMNLITNAFHAVEQNGGMIDITLKEIAIISFDEKGDSPFHAIPGDILAGGYACIKVSDTGTGIDQTLIDKIFDPFFTTKELGKGTGLGLSVVHGIVKEHGGDIRVYSEIGKGTVFHVYLPLLEDTGDTKNAAVIKQYPTGCERIMLVDDEEPIVHMEQMILERLGYQVTVRLSSLDALGAFKANSGNFDLVISDRGMPNMTGEQLAGELMSIRPGIPIILCTGFSNENDVKRAKAMGVKGFLMKPVATGDLAEMVRKVLDETKGCIYVNGSGQSHVIIQADKQKKEKRL
jgi:two-component system cell cycle sensor histidine kinase/response regulator CckA